MFRRPNRGESQIRPSTAGVEHLDVALEVRDVDDRPSLPPADLPPARERTKLSNIALTEAERKRFLASIDRQIAEIDARLNDG